MSKLKERKVFKEHDLPTRFPLWEPITCWLALDHWNAPQWLYGSMGLIFLILWLIAIKNFSNQESVEFLNDDDEDFK